MLKLALAISSVFLLLPLASAQNSGGASGGTADVGNVTDSGLILITTRDPSSYIATAEGMALYTLVDDNGEVLPCNAECLAVWPAYSGAASADEGTGLDASLVGTMQAEDGQELVTYNDYPLYTFSSDQAPVDVTGQGVEGFGGYWYVVGEDGEPVVEEDTTAE